MISADDYLDSAYHPDREYIDGLLVKRCEPTVGHALLQVLVVVCLSQYRKQLHFGLLTEARTQIVARSRYRIPDVMLCPLPLPAGKIVDSIPLAVIEILSPDDTISEQLARFREYKQIGVRHMVLLDPEEMIAYRFADGSLIATGFTSLELPAGPLPFDTAALFRQLAEER